MERKYEFTNYSIMYKGHLLHQIRAVRDFNGIEKGTIGGFIESEYNLSHDGNCWVYDSAFVYEKAHIEENAVVRDNAYVYGKACVCGNAIIKNNAGVHGSANIRDNARITDNAKVFDAVLVYDNAEINDSAYVYGEAIIAGNAMICDKTQVFAYTSIFENAQITEHAVVMGHAKVHGNALIKGNAHITESAVVSNDSIVGDNIVINGNKHINNGVLYKDTLEEQIKCQTGLIPCNGEIIAYKIVNPDLSSLYDSNFKYKIGEWIEAENVSESNISCAPGLHFSNATYWDYSFYSYYEGKPVYLIAKINLDDIITVQAGKIRCRKAFILGKYEV